MSVHPQNLVIRLDDLPAEAVPHRRVGVLALQGDYLEHENVLRRLGVSVVEVRRPSHLEMLDGLIIPGGESTTVGKMATRFGMMEPLRRFVRVGRPVWGTCAGLIFLAKRVGRTWSGGHVIPPRLEVLDVTVDRNAFGRQVDSFEADLDVPALNGFPRSASGNSREGDTPFHAVFIRAPAVESVGKGVTVLARMGDPPAIVAVRQGNLLGTAFHPELTGDDRFHRYFVAMMEGRTNG
jgi:5'-phosphate synthase pdxT subunit